MEVKNTDERTELINPNKSKNKRSDIKLKGQNEKDLKTDVINLDKPINSIRFNNDYTSGNNANNNLFSNNDNVNTFDKNYDPNSKQNGYDGAKTNNDASKNNIKGKQEDISIVDITKGGRIITDLEIKNAPVLVLEVNYFLFFLYLQYAF